MAAAETSIGDSKAGMAEDRFAPATATIASALLQHAAFESPIGTIRLVAEGTALVALDFAPFDERFHRLLQRRYRSYRLVETADPAGAVTRLKRYFHGDRHAFDGLATDPGGTPFQRMVWQALPGIPFGRTTSYGALAARLGRGGSSRAVGHANSQNPIAIVLPCHRVIGSGGALTGYAGGIERKHWLLRHEGVLLT